MNSGGAMFTYTLTATWKCCICGNKWASQEELGPEEVDGPLAGGAWTSQDGFKGFIPAVEAAKQQLRELAKSQCAEK